MELIIMIVCLIAAVAFYIMFTYNDFVGLRVRIEEAWSDIEVQMKRRYDLIPNLVETVKGYAAHEAGTLEEVTRARAEALANHGSPAEQAESENILTGALKSLFALAENYPDLKANENFLHLQRDLSQVEHTIQAARRYYNGTVRNNNTKVARFPSNLVANYFKFGPAEFFELDEEEDAARRPVAVSFD
ncbi:MAG: LemA family protein [Alphaproteobacteria bacterium]|nr:LemA family protein [Alphaproteobacteria bacterium]